MIEDNKYKAFGLGRERERQLSLLIKAKDGHSEILPYAHLLRVKCVSSKRIELKYTHLLIVLEGRYLNYIEGYLQDQKVRFIREHNPSDPPEDKPEKTTITSIKIYESDFPKTNSNPDTGSQAINPHNSLTPEDVDFKEP